MVESEVLPRKFILPIIILIFIALVVPVGNYLATPKEEFSGDWDTTIIIAVFSLSVVLAGIFLLIILNNPPDFSNSLEDNSDEKISYAKREDKLNSGRGL